MVWRQVLIVLVICHAAQSTEEISLAQQLAETSLVSGLEHEGGESLGEPLLGEKAATVTDTEALLEGVSKYDKTSWQNFVSFRATDKQAGAHGDEPERYLRHLDTSMVITTASNRRDQQDAAYILRPPLCPPGDAVKACPVLPTGAVTCFSLESVNYAGHFVSKEVDGNKVELRKPMGGQEPHQTVCARKGLSDETLVSLEFLSAENKMITNRNSLLRLCADPSVEESDGCGKPSEADYKTFATFKKAIGTFVGTCQGPEKLEDCKCVDGWLGKHCNSQCSTTEANGICDGHGKCELNEQLQQANCDCAFGWLAKDCSEQCPMHNGEPCGGLQAGRCYKHPIAGPACKCKSMFLGAQCQLMCPGVLDGKSCSGHGKCTSDAQESEATCECEKGFLGFACDKKCPMLNGRICGGYGRCKLDQYGEASCACEGGRHGEACEMKCPRNPSGLVCSQRGACVVADGDVACACEDGFLGAACEHACPGLIAGRVCSGHGQCATAITSFGDKAAACTCDSTHGGADCLLACPSDEAGNTCSGHGKCGDKGKCECQVGYKGSTCEHKCPLSDSGDVCSAHGKCLESEDLSKSICECQNSHKGPACESSCPVGNGIICSGRGQCDYDALSSQAQCKCKEGFLGNACQFGCPGLSHNDLVCSGHGKCNLFPDTNTPVAAKCSKCLAGFVGPDCSLRCPGLDEGGTPCSGHGKCSQKGDKASCACGKGFLGLACDVECPKEAGIACAGQGRCILGDGKASCKCKEGFLGQACQHTCPTNTKDDKVCSSRGECRVAAEGDRAVCECGPGSVGESCDAGCPMGQNTLPCSGHGACQLDANAGGCKCEDGWTKEDCSHPICTATTGVFNKVTGQCVCPAGNICCDPEAVAAKRAKELNIRKLRTENKQLSAMLMESQTLLDETKSR